MKWLRKMLGFKPKIGDTVEGYLDYGFKYSGVVLKTDYSNPFFPGALVLGKKIYVNINEVTEGQFFIPLAKLSIK